MKPRAPWLMDKQQFRVTRRFLGDWVDVAAGIVDVDDAQDLYNDLCDATDDVLAPLLLLSDVCRKFKENLE